MKRYLVFITFFLATSFPVFAADLELICPCSVATGNQSSLVFQGTIVNRDVNNTSGDLRLRLIAHVDPSPASFFILGDHVFTQTLAPGFAFSASPLTIGYASPTAADYFISILLQEDRSGTWTTVDQARMTEKVGFDSGGGGSWDSTVYFDDDPTANFEGSQVTISLPPIINKSLTESTGNLTVQLRQTNKASVFSSFFTLDTKDLGITLAPNNITTASTITLNFNPVPNDGFDFFYVVVFDTVAGHGLTWHLLRSDELPIIRRSFSLPNVDLLTDTDGDGISDFNEDLVGSNADSALVKPGRSIITVAAFYSQGVEAVVGDPITRIQHLIESANQMYTDSGVNVRLQLVSAVQRDMDESVSNTVLLRDFMDEAKGPFSDINSFRKNNNADLVVAFRPVINDGNCGVANLLGVGEDGIVSRADLANTTVFVECRDRTLIHEIGHIMGLDHSRRQIANAGFFSGTFRWSLGYGVQDQFTTIMADDFGSAQDFNVFSSPSRTCFDVQCGIDRSNVSSGADAALSLNTVRFQVANFTITGAAPVIQLVGASSITIKQNSKFTDPGATATDTEDGELNSSIISRNSIQTDSLGTYEVSYSITDSDGNFATVSRSVIVTADSDVDSDGDGIPDTDDAFPTDPLETIDTDSDGIGNNTDTDDDNDGILDEVEQSVGLDPLNPNDVTGSPREILWRHSVSGLNVLWSMETQHRVERNSINRVADANWRVAGMADFTSDGFDEILFRHQGTGSNRLWTIEDGKRTSSLVFRGVSTDWFIIGMGDFDADGDADMMWRNKLTGSNRYWEMDGATRLSSLPMRGVSLDWSVAGSGDFDGDSRDDLLWRHKNGTNTIWLMQSEVRVARGQIPSVSSPWEVAGVGDFDADGQEDIFWHNPETGANSIWLINGAERKSRGTIPAIAIGWAPFGVHDMNGDGMADILWRHTNGSNRLWLMNGTTRISSLPVRSVADRDWIPVAVGNVLN